MDALISLSYPIQIPASLRHLKLSGRLIVQVVDPVWLPVPAAEITFNRCTRTRKSKSNRTKTDENGYAKFFVPGDADYAIDVELYRFKPGRLKSVHLFDTSSSPDPRYVQIKLRLSGPGTTVY